MIKETASKKNAPTEEAPSHGTEGKQPESILKGMLRTAGEIGQTISGAIQTRDSVVMVRVNKEVLRQLDMLVEAEVCKSRSEAAAYMIGEGIKANDTLYQKIGGVIEAIQKLRAELRQNIQSDLEKKE
jgi:hypothetical protein